MAALTADERNMLRREGVDATTIRLLDHSEQIRKTQHEKNEAQKRFEAQVEENNALLNEMRTRGVIKIGTAAVAGTVLGGGVAYFAHDYIADEFGRATLPALAILPGAGAAVLYYATKKMKSTRAANSTENRALVFGGGFGLLLVGGYLSYEDYAAANPSTP